MRLRATPGKARKFTKLYRCYNFQLSLVCETRGANGRADEGSNILEQVAFSADKCLRAFLRSLLPIKLTYLPINTGSHLGGLECCSYLLRHETSL